MDPRPISNRYRQLIDHAFVKKETDNRPPESGRQHRKSVELLTKYCTGKALLINIGIGVVLLIFIVGLSVGLSVDGRAAVPFKGRDALDSAPLIDGHNDLPYNLYEHLNNNITAFSFEKNLTEDSIFGKKACKSCYTDLPRLRAGKLGAQFWVAYTGCESQYQDTVQLTLRQIDVIKRLIKNYPEDLQLVTKADDIETAWKSGKIASMIAVEGGHSLDSSLAVLRLFHELGVRYVTLTHSCNTPWADASPVGDKPELNITEFGQVIVKEMNRLGMLVDLSHVSHNVMRYVLGMTGAPVMFSHSSAFALCDNYRNVPDDVLEMVKTNEGVVMVNFYSGFVNCNETRKATMQDVVDHINYIRNLIGVDYVGIGADYDGVDEMPEGLEDVSKYPDLFDRLQNNQEGEPSWSKEDLEKLAGRNFIRVFKAVEAVRDSLESEPPYEEIIPGEDLLAAEKKVLPEVEKHSCRTAIEWKEVVPDTTPKPT